MDFKELAKTKEYDFLRTDPRLGDRIILLGVTGSYGYGTNREGSDVDFRGITLDLPSDIIGFTEFEQFEDRITDTVIYSFNKIIKLLMSCNPNTIEILGIDEDEYIVKTEIGQELLDNKVTSDELAKIEEAKKKASEEKSQKSYDKYYEYQYAEFKMHMDRFGLDALELIVATSRC